MCCGEPVEEVEALLDTFGTEVGRELGEENPPVKGAGGVVACAEGFQPLKNAVGAEVVAAGESLREVHLSVVPTSVAQGVIGIGANGAVTLIYGKVLRVDVRAGHEEGHCRWCGYRKVRMLVVSREVSWGGSTLRGFLPKVLPANVSIQKGGQMGDIQLGLV